MPKEWYFPLVRIKQRDDHGCAIAAAATVCGVTYARARHEFFPRRKKFQDDSSLHADSNRIQDAIRRLGFKCRLDHDFDRNCPAILVFRWFGGDDHHAVVWDPIKKRILDPGWDDFNGDTYIQYWKESGYAAILVTGKRH